MIKIPCRLCRAALVCCALKTKCEQQADILYLCQKKVSSSGWTLAVLSRSVFFCSHHSWEFFDRSVGLLLLHPHNPISAGQELNDWLRIQRSKNIAEGNASPPMHHAAEWTRSPVVACSWPEQGSNVANSPSTQLVYMKVLYLMLFLTHIDLSIMYPLVPSPAAEAAWTEDVRAPEWLTHLGHKGTAPLFLQFGSFTVKFYCTYFTHLFFSPSRHLTSIKTNLHRLETWYVKFTIFVLIHVVTSITRSSLGF